MKNTIRQKFKSKRAEMNICEVEDKSKRASELFLKSDLYKNSNILMLYIPIGNEVKTQDIIKNAFSDGKTVLVPVTDKDSYEISAHRIAPDTKFIKGTFSISEPQNSIVFDGDSIDTIVVPGVAFDRKGARVGFGKGCYDKFLNSHSAVKVGLCYDLQICETIETDMFDINMDYILTEKEFIKCMEN